MENLWIESDFVKVTNGFIENLFRQKYEVHWVIRTLYYLQAFCLMTIAILGFTIYLWYVNKSANNNSKIILNNLYGFCALDGIYISIHKFMHLVLNDYFSEENPMMCLLDIYRIYLVSLTNLIMSTISAAILLRHFFPQKYLDYSEKWSNKGFGILILSLSSLHLIWSSKSCGLCQKECIFYELVLILKVSMPCCLLVAICVTIDSVFGFAKIFNRVRNLICKNEITLVYQFNETPTVTFKVGKLYF